jgi:succinate dehydrogenase/fumarate reductase flavoprotein subunit
MAGETYDVIVVGAGNAGLTAALAARQQETRVLLLDKCPKAVRGGNTGRSGDIGFDIGAGTRKNKAARAGGRCVAERL